MWRMASVVVGLAAMAGCAGSPAETPDLRGAVTRLERPDAAFEAVAVLHVAPAADAAASAAVVALTGGTEVWDATPPGGTVDGERRRVDARALAVGQGVEVWYDDPDAGPAPAGATARREARMVVITVPVPGAAP